MIKNESTVYYPMGAGSYVYNTSFFKYIRSQLPKNKVRISIGAQPNSVPHFGTLIVFSLAFSIAKKLMKIYPELSCEVLFEMIDTAPASTRIINDIEYQISLKQKGLQYLPIYRQLLDKLKEYHNVPYSIRGQSEFNSSSYARTIVQHVVEKHELTDAFLSPDTENLRIRVACPQCGYSDKKAKNLIIKGSIIESLCPYHGKYSINAHLRPDLLEYNTPLRNLIRQLIYMCESQDPKVDFCWLRITGSDYAGFYQEQTLYKAASVLGYSINKMPIIVYAPLIIDWSGAKLSKSLYINENAYVDLPQYLLDYQALMDSFGIDGLNFLSDITDEWIDNPSKLFRTYSAEYFQLRFERRFKGPAMKKAYRLSINNRAFNAIYENRKRIEIRANIKDSIDYSAVSKDDYIIFEDLDSSLKILCKVLRIKWYKSIRALLEEEGTEYSLSSTNSIEEGIKSIESFPDYKEAIDNNGVYAIAIEVLSDLFS